ncbi:MAG TPA: TlpA disulfide reductase family protein [Vicinamibacteria bacterium]
MNTRRRFFPILVRGLAGSLALLLAAPFALSQAPPAPVPSPLPGEIVPEFDAVAVAGKVEHVDYPKGTATILLFFLSSCPHCHQMIPRWNEAYTKRSKDVRVYGVILDQEYPGFFTAMPVAFPVLRTPSREFATNIKVMRTPTALRIGPGGKIEDVQVGVKDVMSVGELFRPLR